MLLQELVDTSQRISETTKRLAKIDHLAQLLKRLHPEEVEIATAFLSGRARQGRIGIGWSAIRDAASPPANRAALEILDVDRAFSKIAGVRGSGERIALLHGLLERATDSEQRFLSGLLLGELRQGALEGIMLEAVAKAAGVAVERVRHAAMVAGDIAAIARTVLEKGEAGLDEYGVKLFRPVQPMLAQTAEDVARRAGRSGRRRARVQARRGSDSGSQVRRPGRGLFAGAERCDPGGSGSGGSGAGAAGARSHPRWRGA